MALSLGPRISGDWVGLVERMTCGLVRRAWEYTLTGTMSNMRSLNVSKHACEEANSDWCSEER
jgi:hypothetical protein